MTLQLALLYAIATAGVSLFIRAAPWPKSWKAKKPLSCPTCMGLWSAILTIIGGDWYGLLPRLAVPAYPAIFFVSIAVAAWVGATVIPPPVDFVGDP